MPLPRPPRLTRRRFLGLTAASAAGVVLGACGDDDESASSTTTTAPTAGDAASNAAPTFDGLTITTAVYAKNHASSPLYWQQFAPEGLTVSPQIFTSPSDINRAMENGDLDFGLMGPYTSLVDHEQGLGSRIICMCARGGFGLVGRADQNIETVEDLAGKRIGVPPPGGQLLVLTYLLEEAGLALDDGVTAVPLAFADHPAALERGDIDAYIGTEPLATQSVVSGIGKRIDGVYDTPLGNFNTAMWAAPKHHENEDLLRAVVKMQRDAAEFLTPNGDNDPDVWRDLLVTQFGYTEDVYAEVLTNIGAEWKFGDDRRQQVEDVAELMLRQGLLTQEPDFDTLFLLDYLPDD